MNKCHTPITWHNDTTPALNEDNLNYMDGCIDTIDDRVVALANDPPANALKAEGWAIGEQSGVPVTSGSPYYENNSKYYSQESANEVLKSEGFANGTQGGVPVSSGSPYYENNAKYWKEQAQAIAGQTLSGLTDVSITTPADGQALVYDSGNSEWVNGSIEVAGQYLRLRNIGTSYTAELKNDISTGAFEKVRVGDYLTINGHVYYVAHLDYWLHTGDTECTTHHAVIVPAASLGVGYMNYSATTSGGYLGSDFKTGNGSTVLATIKATIEADFGASNILTHRDFFINSTSNGVSTAGVWVDSDVDLMNEEMVYGSPLSQPANTGSTNYTLWTISKSQLELFQKRPDLLTTGESWWLRDVVNSERFAAIFGDGRGAGAGKANNNNYGIRPAFGIC